MLFANALNLRFDLIRIDPVGGFAREAKENRAIGAVTASCQGQRTVEVDHDVGCRVELAFIGKRTDKTQRGAHRTDGMRARGTETDLEQIESANEHRGRMRVLDSCREDTSGARRASGVPGSNRAVGANSFAHGAVFAQPARMNSGLHCHDRSRVRLMPFIVLLDTALSSRSLALGNSLAVAALAFMACVSAAPAPVSDAGWRAYERGDYAKALQQFERAAKSGDRLAQYNLAMMLIRGDGGRADLEGGIVWLRRSAEAGMAQAQYNLGLLYENGTGVPRSLSDATLWWQKAAEQGLSDAQVQLATQYFLGRGAPKDWKLAAKWYEAAAENGDAGAQYIIASFYEHGNGVARDLRKALEWYVHAARQGDVGAAAQAKDVARRLAATEGTP